MANVDEKSKPESEKPKICPKGQTANPEIGSHDLRTAGDGLKSMQESEQQLSHYYRIIFTLKSGVQIEICSQKSYDELPYSALDDSLVIDGFMNIPLLVEKTIKIVREEIAAIEIIKDPCIAQVIPWPHDGVGVAIGDDGFGPLEERDKVNKPLVNHKPDCAIHNNPPHRFSSEVTTCDCGAWPCADAAGQDRTKPVEGGY